MTYCTCLHTTTTFVTVLYQIMPCYTIQYSIYRRLTQHASWRGGSRVIEFQSGHRVEQFRQMLGHHLRLISIRQNIQQIAGRNEVESRERETLRLQIFCQRFLAEDQLLLEGVERGHEAFFVRRFNDVRRFR